MLQDLRTTIHDLQTRASARFSGVRGAATNTWQRAGTAWGAVDGAERRRLRSHTAAIAGAAGAVLLTLVAGIAPAGPLILADVIIVAAAWLGGFSSGVVATLTVVLVGRIAGLSEPGVPLQLWVAVVIGVKGLLIAGVTAALAARVEADGEELAERDGRIDRLCQDVHRLRTELSATEAASVQTQATMSHETQAARAQLATLQHLTDPAVSGLHGPELVITLLDRLRAAVGADGMALCLVEGRTGRIFSATEGIAPLGAVKRTPTEFREYQARRTTLVHNDPSRVAEGSLCGWPAEITSLISVPIFHGGRLQLVVEAANRQGRRSTEWELLLIQVVAERAAGALRQSTFATGAVA
jgi:hypothetical protein